MIWSWDNVQCLQLRPFSPLRIPRLAKFPESLLFDIPAPSLVNSSSASSDAAVHSKSAEAEMAEICFPANKFTKVINTYIEDIMQVFFYSARFFFLIAPVGDTMIMIILCS